MKQKKEKILAEQGLTVAEYERQKAEAKAAAKLAMKECKAKASQKTREENNRKRSELMKMRWKDPEARDKMVVKRNRVFSIETRIKISQSLKVRCGPALRHMCVLSCNYAYTCEYKRRT
jgi:sRNA-binding protein